MVQSRHCFVATAYYFCQFVHVGLTKPSPVNEAIDYLVMQKFSINE